VTDPHAGGIPCAAAHGLLFIDGDWREPMARAC
jgi:hypothetical protein